jgi:predicted CoA-binding protein
MKTLVIGASANPERYSYKAVKLLRRFQHEVVAFGIHVGKIDDVEITDKFPASSIDTVTLYLNPSHQAEYTERILALHPRRIIFNPGTENGKLKLLAEEKGIITEEACTLVLLNTNQY